MKSYFKWNEETQNSEYENVGCLKHSNSSLSCGIQDLNLDANYSNCDTPNIDINTKGGVIKAFDFSTDFEFKVSNKNGYILCDIMTGSIE